MDDGLNQTFASDEDETLRIDAITMENPESCTSNSSSKLRKVHH